MPNTLNRDILALAIPALGALVAEPVFLLTNTALVAHLGLTALAALGVASALLQTTVGLMIFLAYGTTPQVARRLGAGDRSGAVQVGLSGVWLALIIGVVAACAGALLGPWLTGLFGLSADVTQAATEYWFVSLLGIPAMLGVLASAGILRGLQNTVVPLWISGVGLLGNAVLNAVLLYGFGTGLVGSAWGTVAAQWVMFIAFLAVISQLARVNHASRRPQFAAVLRTARLGGWLFLRTVSLRIALLLPLAVIAPMGAEEFAGFQLIATLFTAAAFALEALEIAGQALTGKALGAADRIETRRILNRILQWGAGFGAILGLALAMLAPSVGIWLSGDAKLGSLIQPSLVVLAVALPIGGVAFMLDGVLIGAGDVRFLGLIGIVNVAILAALLAGVASLNLDGVVGLTLVVAAYFVGYIATRAVTLGVRTRGSAWMHVEAT